MSTTHRATRRPARRDAGPWLGRAWGAVASLPAFFLVAFAVGEGAYALLGYRPENADAPIWAVVVAAVPTLAVILIPCVAAVVWGRRATSEDDRRGLVPLVVGVVAGVAMLVLTVVSEVGNILRR